MGFVCWSDVGNCHVIVWLSDELSPRHLLTSDPLTSKVWRSSRLPSWPCLVTFLRPTGEEGRAGAGARRRRGGVPPGEGRAKRRGGGVPVRLPPLGEQ